MRILISEDDAALAEALRFALTQAGFAVDWVDNGLAADEALKNSGFGLLILDLGLPKLDGLEVHRIVRRESEVPVIMLTARDAEIDRVVGLELGADDYVVKPFSVRELIARVKNVLRRTVPHPITDSPDRLEVGELSIDVTRHEARIGSIVLELTALEFAMLYTLARHAEQVLSREQLLEQVWGYDYHDDLRVVDAVIKRLRAKLRRAAPDAEWIVTVRSVGYKLTQ